MDKKKNSDSSGLMPSQNNKKHEDIASLNGFQKRVRKVVRKINIDLKNVDDRLSHLENVSENIHANLITH